MYINKLQRRNETEVIETSCHFNIQHRSLLVKEHTFQRSQKRPFSPSVYPLAPVFSSCNCNTVSTHWLMDFRQVNLRLEKHKQKLVNLPLHVPLDTSPHLLILHLATPVRPSVTTAGHWTNALRCGETENKTIRGISIYLPDWQLQIIQRWRTCQH